VTYDEAAYLAAAVEAGVRRRLPWEKVPHLVAGQPDDCVCLVRLHFVTPVGASIMEAAFQIASSSDLVPMTIAIEIGAALPEDVRRSMKMAATVSS